MTVRSYRIVARISVAIIAGFVVWWLPTKPGRVGAHAKGKTPETEACLASCLLLAAWCTVTMTPPSPTDALELDALGARRGNQLNQLPQRCKTHGPARVPALALFQVAVGTGSLRELSQNPPCVIFRAASGFCS